MQKYPQIYAEAECNANLFAIAEAQLYMWTVMAKYRKGRANNEIYRDI